ncbi:MAG: hypothetical protein QOD99_2180 [Chthoniobacter sp.]|jgi:hypothetical protein|nr:hypothetical protein [Chthoniobacter sp.]
MKTRNTILLFLIAGGLFAFIHFYESKLPTTAEAADQEKRILKIDRDKISGITITNNEEKIVLRKAGSKWQLEAPIKDRADESAVNQLLTSVEMLKKETSVDAGEGKGRLDPKDVGLAKSNVQLKFDGPDAPPAILFGKDAAVEGKQYVRLENSNTIYVIGNDLKTQLAKKADDFRDRRLTKLNAAQINKVQIKSAAGEIELQKDRDHWQLKKPLSARGDDAKIADQIAQTLNTRIDGFVSGDVTTSAAAAIADSRGTITFYAEGNETPNVLQVSKESEKDKEKVYAKLSGRDAIFLMPKAIAALLDVKPNDVRDKHLARVNLDIVDRINIEAAGKPKITLARKQEEWTLKSSGDKAANAVEVRKMAAALQNQEVAGFVSDVATDLPKYGLDEPQLKVNFASYASDNTAESKAGESSIVTVLFGKADGENIYAKLDTEPFIVSVKKSALGDVRRDPLEWQDLAIFKLKPEEAVALEVTKAGQAPFALAKEKDTWKATKGDALVNAINVQSMLNTLTALRAVRWVGGTKPEHGLDKPALVIALTTADQKTIKLRVGAATPETMYFAAADGQEGTFVISRPDYEALDASLSQNTQATPKASASPVSTTSAPLDSESAPRDAVPSATPGP